MWANDFFDFFQFLQVGHHWPKSFSSKGILLQPSESAIPACHLQNGWKIAPYLASKTSVTTAHRNGIQMKHHHSNIYSPYYSPYIERLIYRHFRERTWRRLPKATKFHSETAQFQLHSLYLMQSQILHSNSQVVEHVYNHPRYVIRFHSHILKK